MVELVVLDGLTSADAAVALGLDGAAARMRLARARRKLRLVLGGEATIASQGARSDHEETEVMT